MIRIVVIATLLLSVLSCSSAQIATESKFDIFRQNFFSFKTTTDVESFYGAPNLKAESDVSIHYFYFDGRMTRMAFNFDIKSRNLASAHWVTKSEEKENGLEYIKALYADGNWKRTDFEWKTHAAPIEFLLNNEKLNITLSLYKRTPDLVESIFFEKENVKLPKANRRIAVVSENK